MIGPKIQSYIHKPSKEAAQDAINALRGTLLKAQVYIISYDFPFLESRKFIVAKIMARNSQLLLVLGLRRILVVLVRTPSPTSSMQLHV